VFKKALWIPNKTVEIFVVQLQVCQSERTVRLRLLLAYRTTHTAVHAQARKQLVLAIVEGYDGSKAFLKGQFLHPAHYFLADRTIFEIEDHRIVARDELCSTNGVLVKFNLLRECYHQL